MIHREDLPETPEWQLPDRCAASEAAQTVPPNIELGEN